MGRKIFLSLLAVLCSLGFLAPTFRAAGQANGIYADFATSMGSFTCKLEYAIAPKAVANFIGLAKGQRSWLDLPSGRAKTNAFYNGLIFHRVVPGFVIQAGSPNQQGTDGPGYVFPDEISPSLRFTNSGVLAMANSGTNSNGSQFFLTLANASFLNDGYTAFGELIGGTNVMLAIGQVATDANSKPLTNVVIQNIGIRTVGTAAQAFDSNLQNLPIVTNLNLKIANSATQVGLSFSNRLNVENKLYASSDLHNWGSESLGFEVSVPFTNTFYRPKNGSSTFYEAAQIQYPSSTFTPRTVYNRKLTIFFNVGILGNLTNNFDNSGSGTYTYVSSTFTNNGAILGYNWVQEAYRGQLAPIGFSGLVPMYLRVNFNNSSITNGIINGTAYPNYPSSAGAFTIGGPFIFN
jgi:peptidyl-prolyl cis-trans isomerase A (cyclophilin A)